MKKVLAVLAGIALAVSVAVPANAAKPVSTTNQMTTTAVVSAYDGSEWLLFQSERINQPGNAVWAIQWFESDGSPCTYQSQGYTYAQLTTGQVGSQTGATWGPT